MSRRTRAVIALAGVVLTAGGTAVATAPGATAAPAVVSAKKPAPLPAFSTVATLDMYGDQVAAPETGVAYVLGEKVDSAAGTSQAVLQRWSGGTTTTVLSTSYSQKPFLTSAPGAVFVYVPGQIGSSTLYSVSGTTATPMTIPVPAGYAAFDVASMAADSATSLWVTGQAYSAPDPATGARTVLRDIVQHWDGSSWTALPSFGKGSTYSTTYAKDGQVYVVWHHSGFMEPTFSGVVHWDGSAWVTVPDPARVWTLASGADYTLWGENLVTVQNGGVYTTTGRPTCNHVVNGVESTCPAPAGTPIDATRLANGAVVLAGGSGDGGVAPFAYVAQDGAVPVAMSSDPARQAVSVAAEPTGSVVWALTSTYVSGITTPVYSLQRVDLAVKVTGKKVRG